MASFLFSFYLGTSHHPRRGALLVCSTKWPIVVAVSLILLLIMSGLVGTFTPPTPINRHHSHCRAILTPQQGAIASLPTLSSSTVLWSSSSSSFVPDGDDVMAAQRRAGSDGYSVLRQPVSPTNWDPRVDPTFEVPSTLNNNNNNRQASQLDDEWWSSNNNNNNNNNNRNQRATTAAAFAADNTNNNNEDDENDDLNLFQRSLDTLDYPRVLKALQDECTTVPARNLVRQAATAAATATADSSSLTNQNNNNKRATTKHNNKRAHQPLMADSPEGCQERYAAVQEMEWILRNGANSRLLDGCTYRNRQGYQIDLAGRPPPLNGNPFDLESLLEQATTQGRVLETADILEVSSMMDTLEDITRWSQGLQKVQELDFVELPKLTAGIAVNTTLHDLLQTAFDDEGRLSGRTFAEIGRLRATVRSLKTAVLDQLNALLALPSIQSQLALESGGPAYSQVQGGRLVIPIRSNSKKSSSSLGIVHDTSRSGQTVYIEPTELVGPTNQLRQAEGELRAAEAAVWRQLTAEILHNRVPLQTAVLAAGQLDLVLARVLLGRRLQSTNTSSNQNDNDQLTIPVVGSEGVISVHNAKHPVLLLRHQHDQQDVVGSTVELGGGKNQGLVLTGPNSGGKTVILKLLGLYALMARAGIPLPADGYHNKNDNDNVNDNDDKEERGDSNHRHQPRVDFFHPVLADIGDIQSVGGDLSTFSGHMLVCREVLKNAGQNALVLMDEVGSGTDPAQGVALAQALLEALLETGARVAITTHYMQLKQLAAADERFAVAGMQFVQGRPTYRLLPGTVGESFALAVAERLQLPGRVLERATELLDTETRQMGDLIRELEDQKARLEEQSLELQQRRQQVASMEFKLKEETRRLEKKQLSARRDEAKKFATKLEEKERVLEDVLQKLRSDPSRRILAKSWDDIRFVKRDALNEAENVPSVVARKQQAAAAMQEASDQLVPLAEMRTRPDLKEGDTLVVCKQGPLFGRQGSITKVLGGRVEIRVNNMNVSFKWSEVALPNKNTNNAALPLASTGRTSKRARGKSVSRAAEKAIAAEMNANRGPASRNMAAGAAPTEQQTSSSRGGGVEMRTHSNTVDVRGCNLQEAQEKVKNKFSSCLLSGRSVVYILHGHGTGGILKSKVRNWLKSERQLVKRFKAASVSDGGDAFTQVELR